jgi:hypothetical protein
VSVFSTRTVHVPAGYMPAIVSRTAGLVKAERRRRNRAARAARKRNRGR